MKKQGSKGSHLGRIHILMLTTDLIPIGHPGAGLVATGYAILLVGVCIFLVKISLLNHTSSTAQGGGGSFRIGKL